MLNLPPLLLSLVQRDLLIPTTILPFQSHLERVQPGPHGIYIAHFSQVVRDEDLCNISRLFVDYSSDAYDLTILEGGLLLACYEVMSKVVRHCVETCQETQAWLYNIGPLLGLFFLSLPLVRDVRIFFLDLLLFQLFRS